MIEFNNETANLVAMWLMGITAFLSFTMALLWVHLLHRWAFLFQEVIDLERHKFNYFRCIKKT